jgi:hypothetical protein
MKDLVEIFLILIVSFLGALLLGKITYEIGFDAGMDSSSACIMEGR